MNMPLGRSYRLATRGEAGLVCDTNGISLGGVDLVRVHPGARNNHCEVRSHDEINDILHAAYGAQPNEVAVRVQRRLHRAASWLEAGDVGRAGIEVVGLGLPDLTPEALTKLALIADLEKAGDAWRNEPRIPSAQTGGGEWTSGGGGAPTRKPSEAASSTASSGTVSPDLHSGSSPGPRSPAPLLSTRPAFQSEVNSLLIPVSTVAVPVGGLGPASEVALPAEAIRFGRAGALGIAATLLDNWRTGEERKQLNDAMVRFRLDPARPADVVAAVAYVWSIHYLWLSPGVKDVPNRGPGLDAAAQSVMRFVMMYPGVFTHPNAKSVKIIADAANAGYNDYIHESTRPPGVDRKYQTTSTSARSAADVETQKGRYIAHHLIAPNVWADYMGIVALASQAGWKVDERQNIILLPKDIAAQRELAPTLPIHNGPHGNYDGVTRSIIDQLLNKSPSPMTPDGALTVFRNASRINRVAITNGLYGYWLKAAQ